MADGPHAGTTGSARIGSDVARIDDRALVNLRCPDASVLPAHVLGVALPVVANSFVAAGDRLIAWLGPDEWLIVGAPGEQGRLCALLDDAIAGEHHAVTDISGSRTTFRLSGAAAYEIFAAASSFDFHPGSFAPGNCTQTSFARTGAWVMKRDDRPTFDLLVRRSFASYVETWLDAATSSFAARPRSSARR